MGPVALRDLRLSGFQLVLQIALLPPSLPALPLMQRCSTKHASQSSIAVKVLYPRVTYLADQITSANGGSIKKNVQTQITER